MHLTLRVMFGTKKIQSMLSARPIIGRVEITSTVEICIAKKQNSFLTIGKADSILLIALCKMCIFFLQNKICSTSRSDLLKRIFPVIVSELALADTLAGCVII